MWYQQYSTTVDIHGPLQTTGEARCLVGVSVSRLASRTQVKLTPPLTMPLEEGPPRKP